MPSLLSTYLNRALMQTRSLQSALAAVLLGLSLPALAATTTLNPTADAYVQNGTNATKNYGTNIQLRAQTNATAASNYDSYLKFDTTSATGIVTSAKLRLYAAVSKAGTLSTSAYAVANTTWGETTLTWNTKPALGSSLGSATINATTYAWYEIDVTAYVQSEKTAGRNVISLGLHNAATSSIYAIANSREATSNKPQLVIVTNLAPTVSLTAPTNGSSYTAPASINLAATATDDGTIQKVEFYNGSTLLGTATASPYTYTWSNVAPGNYSLTAKATDNLGATTVSSPVSITVNQPVVHGTFYIYPDHLNTPRMITDTANKVVWRWDSDPFGNTTPNEDPDGDGVPFTYNPRFPGQYYDAESGLNYNWHRYYDPTAGRYTTSDPIGLAGGLNLYSYVEGNPLSYVDPTGQSALGAATIGVLTFVTGYGLYDAYQASKPDSCDCKDKLDKAKKILQALRQKFPSRYKKDLSVGVRDIPIGGVTYITNGDKIFISSEYCSGKYPWLTDADLADTVAHEALHANDPWYQRIGPVIGSEFDNGTHHSDTARQGTSDAQAVTGGR